MATDLATGRQNQHTDKEYFNVEVFGDYFVSTAQGNVVRPFGPAFLKMRRWESSQTLARFHVLPKLIHDVDAEFKEIRRCIVVSITDAGGNPVHGLPIAFMSRDQIAMEARSKGFPLNVDMYNDIITLRSKLRTARANPDQFRKNEQRFIKSYARVGDAMELNKNVFTNLVNEQKVAKDDEVNLVNNAGTGVYQNKCTQCHEVFNGVKNEPVCGVCLDKQSQPSADDPTLINEPGISELPAETDGDEEFEL